MKHYKYSHHLIASSLISLIYFSLPASADNFRQEQQQRDMERRQDELERQQRQQQREQQDRDIQRQNEESKRRAEDFKENRNGRLRGPEIFKEMLNYETNQD